MPNIIWHARKFLFLSTSFNFWCCRLIFLVNKIHLIDFCPVVFSGGLLLGYSMLCSRARTTQPKIPTEIPTQNLYILWIQPLAIPRIVWAVRMKNIESNSYAKFRFDIPHKNEWILNATAVPSLLSVCICLCVFMIIVFVACGHSTCWIPMMFDIWTQYRMKRTHTHALFHPIVSASNCNNANQSRVGSRNTCFCQRWLRRRKIYTQDFRQSH